MAAPAAPAPASDNETPGARPQARPRYLVSPRPHEISAALRHPGSGFTLDIGGFGGGADLATAQLSDGSTETLSAGSGGFVSVGAMWTPVWLGDAVGFGVGGYVGVKYDQIGGSNASLSLTRFPVGGGAHALIRISERWFLLLRGGVQRELGISLSGSGDVSGSANLEGSLGGLGEAGFYWVSGELGDHLAGLISFRYTSAHDSTNLGTIEANSAGVILGLLYDL